LVCSSSNDTVVIDSRTSDALAIAVRFGCPIYTYENILIQAGVLMDDENKKVGAPASGPASVTSETGGPDNLKTMSTKDLNSMLNDVLDQEDYIKAIAIRDELKRRSEK
jgi:bifunctional DNase/RNase